ncbi:hypothetical protein BC567DRAFT_231693 [Phyllosticta citribraziliensis]
MRTWPAGYATRHIDQQRTSARRASFFVAFMGGLPGLSFCDLRYNRSSLPSLIYFQRSTTVEVMCSKFLKGLKLSSSRHERNINLKSEQQTVWIFLTLESGRRTSTVLTLWCPPLDLDASLISMPVVVELLGLEIQEYESDIDFYGRKIRTKGYVDLDWGLIKSRPTFRTRFLVVQQGNPRFDIVLGRRAALDYGLIDSRCYSTPASQPVRMISGYEKGFRVRAPGRA